MQADRPRFLTPAGYGRRADFIKVLGERNTGTRFLEDLLRRNLGGVEVIRRIELDRRLVRSYASRFEGPARKMIRERVIDDFRLQTFDRDYGWKHAAISPGYLARSERCAATLFVCIVRNPYSWLRSIHRRSHNVPVEPPDDFDAFLGETFFLNQRDNLPRTYLEGGPVALWNAKVQSYLDCLDAMPNVLVVRYEDAVNFPAELLGKIAETGAEVAARLDIPMESTKGGEHDYAAYRRLVNAFRPAAEFSPSTLGTIADRLDAKLCDRVGYDVVVPAATAG